MQDSAENEGKNTIFGNLLAMLPEGPSANISDMTSLLFHGKQSIVA